MAVSAFQGCQFPLMAFQGWLWAEIARENWKQTIQCFFFHHRSGVVWSWWALVSNMQRILVCEGCQSSLRHTETRRCFQTNTQSGVSLRAQVSRRCCCCQPLVCFLSRCGHDGIHSFQCQHKHDAENASSAQMALFCGEGIVVIWIQLFCAWFMC